jgi:hypothetical protein
MGKSKAAEVREQAAETASDVRERAADAAATLADTAGGVAGKVSGSAADLASKVQDVMPDAVQDKAGDLGEAAGRKRRPLALILAVAAAVTIALRFLRAKR